MPNTDCPFARRKNPNGTIDSICKTCFATVGTREYADDLNTLEDRHVCNPWRLEVINTLVLKAKKT